MPIYDENEAVDRITSTNTVSEVIAVFKSKKFSKFLNTSHLDEIELAIHESEKAHYGNGTKKITGVRFDNPRFLVGSLKEEFDLYLLVNGLCFKIDDKSWFVEDWIIKCYTLNHINMDAKMKKYYKGGQRLFFLKKKGTENFIPLITE